MHTIPAAWKCPACQTSIDHDGEGPRYGVVYRCHVCRLELIADFDAEKLILAPLPAPRQNPEESSPTDKKLTGRAAHAKSVR